MGRGVMATRRDNLALRAARKYSKHDFILERKLHVYVFLNSQISAFMQGWEFRPAPRYIATHLGSKQR